MQSAKVLHRLASGSHKRWPPQGALANELHVYPASRGNVLRDIGAALEGAAEFLVEYRLKAIRRFKDSHERRARSILRPIRARSEFAVATARVLKLLFLRQIYSNSEIDHY